MPWLATALRKLWHEPECRIEEGDYRAPEMGSDQCGSGYYGAQEDLSNASQSRFLEGAIFCRLSLAI